MIEREKHSTSELVKARRLFSRDKLGSSLYRKALIDAGRSPQELIELRKQFGEGNAGQISFMYIAIKSPCEVVKKDKEGVEKPCGKEGNMTFYFDIGGTEDFLVCCSEEDFQLALKRYDTEMESQGRWGVASKNGRGRV